VIHRIIDGKGVRIRRCCRPRDEKRIAAQEVADRRVVEARTQPARREISGSNGGVRPARRVGIQPEQADERVGRAKESSTGRVTRCELLETELPAIQSRSSSKTAHCSLGEVPGQRLKLPGKL
jgi:hypothetical protein